VKQHEIHDPTRDPKALPVHFAVCSGAKVGERAGERGHPAPFLRRGTHGSRLLEQHLTTFTRTELNLQTAPHSTHPNGLRLCDVNSPPQHGCRRNDKTPTSSRPCCEVGPRIRDPTCFRAECPTPKRLPCDCDDFCT
jgi:hypothetical protein